MEEEQESVRFCHPDDIGQYCVGRVEGSMSDDWVIDEIHYHYGSKAPSPLPRNPPFLRVTRYDTRSGFTCN